MRQISCGEWGNQLYTGFSGLKQLCGAVRPGYTGSHHWDRGQGAWGALQGTPWYCYRFWRRLCHWYGKGNDLLCRCAWAGFQTQVCHHPHNQRNRFRGYLRCRDNWFGNKEQASDLIRRYPGRCGDPWSKADPVCASGYHREYGYGCADTCAGSLCCQRL